LREWLVRRISLIFNSLQFFINIVGLECSSVLPIPLGTFFIMPFLLTFIGTAGLLSITNTWIGNKPFPAYSAGTLLDVTGIDHDVLLNYSGKQRYVKKEKEFNWVGL